MAEEPHPQVQALLTMIESMDVPKLHEMSPQEARATMDPLFARAAGEEPVGAVEDRAIPGPDGDVPVRIYRPETEGPQPTVVFFHGGGFVIGTLDTHDAVCRALTNEAEAVVVSVDYRLAPEHPFPAAVADAHAATEWASDNLGELGGNGFLAVAGDSAGGTLAAVTCLLARDRGPAIDHQCLVYPATASDGDPESFPSREENADGYFLETADMEWFFEQYIADEFDAYNPLAFPLQARDCSGLPPALVITAGFDPLRDEGRAYAERLEAAGVDTTYREFEGMVHGFVSMLGDPGVDTARAGIEAIAAELDARDA
ncbi:alpha/beta hydrolase [Haloarchaeobius iranensis]|uniref:Acetyl esterase n=1 Tax=Haloarchaeobius iranensis TaxID=996166 RepID=A0A1G9Z785_9EURY|nr:alpha/beta hydrolase [Haloarchaeobius iranensis]SDN17242.1 acetyl esterase [Haloarchaeobius iranensis]